MLVDCINEVSYSQILGVRKKEEKGKRKEKEKAVYQQAS
jgi:hypothetical protein